MIDSMIDERPRWALSKRRGEHPTPDFEAVDLLLVTLAYEPGAMLRDICFPVGSIVPLEGRAGLSRETVTKGLCSDEVST